MLETKSLCAKIPVELHTRVRDSQVESGETLNEYMEKLITEYYEMKEGKNMTQTKTLAIQIPEEMSVRIKEHIAKTPKLTLKSFLIGIIEQALDTADQAEESQTEPSEVEPNQLEPKEGEHGIDESTEDELIDDELNVDELTEEELALDEQGTE